MKNSAVLRVFVLLSFVLAGLHAVHAQAGSGTIVGTVSDPSGAVIPSSAKITVTDHNTGTSREVEANSQGYYVVPTLPPAVYDIAVSSPNFQVVKRNGVTLLADQHLTVDVQLTIAGSKQVVSVSDVSPSQVDTTSSTLSQVVEQKRIVDLPLNGRNAVQLATLVPGRSRRRPAMRTRDSTRRCRWPSPSPPTAPARTRRRSISMVPRTTMSTRT